ncbi:Arylsulfatase A [bacterium A37T11]|nr:Arylsulfatase A [bacterium A37T11]
MYRIVCFFSFFLVSAIYGQEKSSRPNIIWIVSEDNSPFIGAYGDKEATTPNIDKLAREGILFQNAYCTAAVCSPSRSTLITGVYPPAIGTENMRSEYPLPSFIRLFPAYLKDAGYYTTNNAKKDYNTVDQPEVWDESSDTATYKHRSNNQPFFAVFNLMTTHESSIFPDKVKRAMYAHYMHVPLDSIKLPPTGPLIHDPERMHIPSYLPATTEMKHDWALYYDKMTQMDSQVGKLLKDLEDAGLADNTIVFYYGDNGGVLGRSKRFMFESGLRIPLVVRIPENYRNLNPYGAGSRVNRLVDFADFAPTLLHLAGVKVPSYMQGKPFLGEDIAPDGGRDWVFGFRGRMDERFDLVRTIRDKKYRYVRNFMPHKIYGQPIQFLWMVPSMQSWEQAYKAGQLNDTQSAFFKEKPVEELYDVAADPDNVHNLAGLPAYATVLAGLRKKTFDLLVNLQDVGFIPEGAAEEISKMGSLYDYARSGKYDVRKVIHVADIASSRRTDKLPELIQAFSDPDPVIRYWGAVGATVLKGNARGALGGLHVLIHDTAAYVRVAAAEALYGLGEHAQALNVLSDALKSGNTMVRLQALNVLMLASVAELKPLQNDLSLIVKQNVSEYDVKAAQFLLKKLGHE